MGRLLADYYAGLQREARVEDQKREIAEAVRVAVDEHVAFLVRADYVSVPVMLADLGEMSLREIMDSRAERLAEQG